MEDEFEESRKLVKDLYKDLRIAADMNEEIFLMPLALYNRIMKKMGHIDDRIKSQTKSLNNHLKEKQELKRKVKELEATKK